ncbi:hypothetical protein [Brevibacillus choshinensis]|uniref:DUF368 domain-containing protein n=1 Tax=Brevibacillus choshinensis TaxID=54911 RepID=A0ABX7FI46_BRECH|nr:hypothetical protein [Brevibacillus choshinensis]QRG65270.1 hypothetical protein JNE38_16640 [Brevibacillus choshinensis]
MVTYFKGCTGSLIGSTLVYFLLIHNPLENIKLLAIITPFIFIGGIFGYFLFQILHAKNIISYWLGLFSFALLGGLFALILQFFLPFPYQLTLITVFGSITFFLSQLIKNVVLSRVLAVIGPLISLILGFATRQM